MRSKCLRLVRQADDNLPGLAYRGRMAVGMSICVLASERYRHSPPPISPKQDTW